MTLTDKSEKNLLHNPVYGIAALHVLNDSKMLPVVNIVMEQPEGLYTKTWTPPKSGKLIKPVQSPSSVPLIGGSRSGPMIMWFP